MNNKRIVLNIISLLFGMEVLTASLINTFCRNDPSFRVFLAFLSLVYFLPINAIINETLGFTSPAIVKIILGIFIVWVSLGMGKLFNKINLMLMD